MEDAAIVLQKNARRWLVMRMMQRARAQIKLQQAMEAMSAALYGSKGPIQAENEQSTQAEEPARAQTAPTGRFRARNAPQHHRRRLLIDLDLERRRARRSALRSAHADQRQRSTSSSKSRILTNLQDDIMHRRRPVQTPTAPDFLPHSHPPASAPDQPIPPHQQASAPRRPPGERGRHATPRIDSGAPQPWCYASSLAHDTPAAWNPSTLARPPQIAPALGGGTLCPVRGNRGWPQELQEMVEFGEAVYGQYQRGIVPSTPDRSTPTAPEGPPTAALSMDVGSLGGMDSLLELWERGRGGTAPDSPGGIAHVLSQTQQARCLAGLGPCFQQLLGSYEMLWRHPETVRVDERDWLARRVMGNTADLGAEELKPLEGRIVRTAADLGPLVRELDKARTPSIGQWRSPPVHAAADFCLLAPQPRTPALTEDRSGGAGPEAASPELSCREPWVTADVTLRGSSCREHAHTVQHSQPGDDPWSHGGVQDLGEGALCSGPASQHSDGAGAAVDAEPCYGGECGYLSIRYPSCHELFDEVGGGATGAGLRAPELESSVSHLVRTITGDAGLAGALHRLCTAVHPLAETLSRCLEGGRWNAR